MKRFIKCFVIGFIVVTLCNCTVTSKTTSHGCDLMKNGQKCLVDHSCCEK